MVFSPAYDLVATALVNPVDDEELALTLNGKKKRLKKANFVAAFNTLKLRGKQQQNIFSKMLQAKQAWKAIINKSFLSPDFKIQLTELINHRLEIIS